MNYFDRTKEWVKSNLGGDLDKGIWAKINFTEIVQDKEEFIGEISVVFRDEGFKRKRKNKMEEDGVIYYTTEDIKRLYKHLQSGEQENLQETAQNSSQLAKAFGNNYEGPALKYFEEHLNNCSEEWKTYPEKWHSPYFSVVQSSGYGKSRMCKEFACTNLDWWTIYVCLRKENTSGYPPRHQHAVASLKDIAGHSATTSETLIELMGKWIHAWGWVRAVCHYVFIISLDDTRQYLNEPTFMHHVSDLVTQLKKESNKKQEESANNPTQAKKPKTQESELSVRIKILEAYTSTSTQNRLSAKDSLETSERQYFWKLCEKPTTADQLHQFVNELWLLENDSLLFKTRVRAKTLFVLDEARFLIETKTEKVKDYTLFRLFRGALKETKNTFAVLVDTTSRLSNFAPPWSADPSNRRILSDTGRPEKALLPPFNCVTTADVLNTSQSPYALGRPLWDTTLQGYCLEGGLMKLKEFAWDKLTCYKHGYSTTVVIAMLSILTGISISPISSTVMDLVGSHMATCWAIDKNRKAMFVSYPVEPILAEAVLDKVRHFSEDELMTNLLDPLSCQLRLGVVNSGHSGELVVKFLFLLARCKSSQAFENCTVSKLMEAMFGKPMSTLFENQCTEEVAEGEISFTCFSKVMRWDKKLEDVWDHKNPQAILKAFFERRAAMEFPDNQPGADLLVPVRLDGDKYKYILIQAKNVRSTLPRKARDKLTPDKVFTKPGSQWIHYDIGFHMLINVASPPPPTKKAQDNVTFDGKILEVVRIEAFSNLQLQVKNGLQRILREKSVEQWVDEKEKAKVLNFDTLWRAVYALEESQNEDSAMSVDID